MMGFTMVRDASSSCPFGPDLQRYWDLRYELFSRFDEGIELDREGLYSATAEADALDMADRVPGKRVLDAFGGVGGNAIGFARRGKSVICVEKDPARAHMIRTNAKVYEVDALIEVINADIFDVIGSVSADALYLAPPWGGPDYYKKDKFLMTDFAPSPVEVTEALPSAFRGTITLTGPVNLPNTEMALVASEWSTLVSRRADGRPKYFTHTWDHDPE